MSKFNFRHPLFPSIVAEFAFPLLGYFFWEWNLFYIMIFYAADLLSLTIINGVKQRWVLFPPTKTIKTENEKKRYKSGVLKVTVAGIVGVSFFSLGLTYAYHLIEPQHDSWSTFVVRFFKEEFLLLIVLPLARWMEFNFFFKMRRRYLVVKHIDLVNNFLKNQILILLFTLVAVLMAFLQTPEIYIIALGVTLKLFFDLWKMKSM